MVEIQDKAYRKIVSEYKQRAKDVRMLQILKEPGLLIFKKYSLLQIASGKLKKTSNLDSGVGMLMNLRKIANHPLLIRRHFDNDQVRNIGSTIKSLIFLKMWSIMRTK